MADNLIKLKNYARRLANLPLIEEDSSPTIESYEDKQKRMARERRENNAKVLKSYRIKR